MCTEIYGDVLFLIDFSIDFLVLFATAKILHIKFNAPCTALASCLGGVYSVLSLLIRHGAVSVACSLAAAVLICLIAFGIGFPKTLGKAALSFFALSALLGGTVTACYSLLDSLLSADTFQSTNSVSLPVFVAVCLACFALAFVSGKIFAPAVTQKTVRLKICTNNTSIEVCLLVDSGNLLVEPISSLPVAVVKKSLLEPILTDEIDTKNVKIRVVPVKTATGNDLLVGFVPDFACIITGREKNKAVNCVVVGCADGSMPTLDGIFPAMLM